MRLHRVAGTVEMSAKERSALRFARGRRKGRRSPAIGASILLVVFVGSLVAAILGPADGQGPLFSLHVLLTLIHG